MSKFVGILDLLAVAGVVFVLERDGSVSDSVDLGLGVLVVVGLPLASRKFSVSFTLHLLLWSGVFLPILKNPSQGLREHINSVLQWILLFLCLWSSFCVISDNALEILLEFFRAVFDSLAAVVLSVGSFAALFPKSLHLLKKQLGIDQDRSLKYVVCPLQVTSLSQ